MTRLILAVAIGLLAVGHVSAQCGYWQSPYPVIIVVPYVPQGNAIRGVPTLPVPRSAPFVPKKGVGLKEEESKPTVRPKEPKKEPKRKDPVAPKLPKLKPPLPDDPDFKDPPAPKKKEPLVDDANAIEQYIVPSEQKLSKSGPEVRVGFFNHSERQIVITVNGEQLKIPASQYVTLKLPRTFTWSEKGRKARDVVVPPDADGIEIVFRR